MGVNKDKSKLHSLNNSDHNINLRGGSSMDDFVKKKQDNAQVLFMMQSNTLVPATDTALSPKENKGKSIITLENADLHIDSN